MDEIWKPVSQFEDLYEVSSLGRVRRIGATKFSRKDLPRFIRPQRKGAGYAGVSLYRNAKEHQTYVHILVARAFFGEYPEGKEPNHKNGDKFDNRLENLELLSHSRNCSHAHANLLSVSRNPDGTFKKFHHKLMAPSRLVG